MWLGSACGPIVTRTAYVETDTYISSADTGNHSEQSEIRISNLNGVEERAFLKLPTGERDPSKSTEDVFGNLENPLLWPVLPFVILFDIFASFFGCPHNEPLTATNFTDSFLYLNVADNSGGASLTAIKLQHLAKPWWHSVSWLQAFPFSSAGMWSAAGGDLDSAFTPIAGEDDGNGTIKFDVSAYFRTLLANQTTPHYGFALRSASGATLTQVKLKSVQALQYNERPRLVSRYTCTTSASALTSVMVQGRDQKASAPKPYTYVLGGQN